MMDESYWEQRYKNGDTPWEKGQPCPGLLQFLEEDRVQGSVLVPGCGLGHDARALAAMEAEVTAIDIAPAALQAARRLGRLARLRFLKRDLLQLPKAWHEQFDWVWEHTCFCALDPSLRKDYVRAVAGALKPGGRLLGIFYVDPEPDEEGPPFNSSLEELDELFSSFFVLEKQWRPSSCYPGREGCEWMRLLRKKSAF